MTTLMLLLFLNNLLAEIVITPQQWDFGTINNSKLVQNEVAIKNSDLKTVHLRLISTCICLDVQPDEVLDAEVVLSSSLGSCTSCKTKSVSSSEL